MQLEFLPDEYSIYRLPANLNSDANAPEGQTRIARIVNQIESEIKTFEFYSVSRTSEETSIVLPTRLDFTLGQAFTSSQTSGQNSNFASEIKTESGFRCFRVNGPLAFDVIGIIAAISRVLADAQIPLLSLSTFDTDYFLVGSQMESTCRKELIKAGYSFSC